MLRGGYNLLTCGVQMLKFIVFLCGLNPLFMLNKLFLFVVLTVLSATMVNAQVTTSSAVGTVKGLNDEALVGATIVFTHTPTGTVYNTVTKAGGTFNVQNMNPGGPYTLDVTNVGYEAYQLT